MATDLCSLSVVVSPSGASACTDITNNWTVLEAIRLFFCCLQTADFFKLKIDKRFQWLNHSSDTLNFNVPAAYEICLHDTDASAAPDEIRVYMEGVLQHPTTMALDTSPSSVGFYTISILGSTITLMFGGPVPDNCRVTVFVPVCIDNLDC